VTEAPEITDNRSPFFELARLLVRPDHIATFIVNGNHSAM
jgi:hypothetical protein